jgi:hypothetical protein
MGDGLVLGPEVGSTAEGTFTQSDDTILRLVTSSGPPCQISGAPFFTTSHYAYVEVFNPNGQAAKVEIGVDAAPDQLLDLSLVAAYAALPSTDDQRKACLTGAELSCSGSRAPHKSCLAANHAPTIPARGSIWIYVGNFSTEDPAVSFVLSAMVLEML